MDIMTRVLLMVTKGYVQTDLNDFDALKKTCYDLRDKYMEESVYNY